MFTDSHAHLDWPELASQRRQVLERARQAGITRILQVLCAGSQGCNIQEAVKAAEDDPEVWLAVGVHPHDASAMTPELEAELLNWATHPKVLGWGEIGLDYYYDNSPRDIQEKVFVRQLELARELSQPVIIHSRDAPDDTCRLIERHFAHGDHPGGVMHCFTYDRKVADRCLKFGFHLSFGGIVTFPRSEELREVARRVPEGRYLIETDSPFLAPVPYRGKTNEPAFVVKVAEKLAEVRGASAELVGKQTSRNFTSLFSPPA